MANADKLTDLTYSEIFAIADSVTPAETSAFLIATLYGSDEIPDAIRSHLPAATSKMAQMGWMLFTRMMAVKEDKSRKPTKKVGRKTAARKKAAKNPKGAK